MFPPDPPRRTGPLVFALGISLLVHGLILFLAPRTPLDAGRPAPTLQARLEARQAREPTAASAPPPASAAPHPPKPAPTQTARAERRPPVLTAQAPSSARALAASPTWSIAQKQEMDRFLDDLATDARRAPSLAERSLAMAREIGREQARRNDDAYDLVERRPNSPEIDPLSLEMYMESLIRKLNKAAGFVRNDPRTRGVQTASVLVRIAPDGSLESFKVLRVADQQSEIEFTHAVVRQASPFAAFPPDIQRSARSLAMLICIRPPSLSGGAFGFTRMTEGRGCG